jgi:hypothetical protein
MRGRTDDDSAQEDEEKPKHPPILCVHAHQKMQDVKAQERNVTKTRLESGRKNKKAREVGYLKEWKQPATTPSQRRGQ